MTPAESLSIDAISERCERLVRQSPADCTLVTWIEGNRGQVIESARTRRAEVAATRAVIFRVREGGRTGTARAESADVGELQTTLRQALAAARLAATSPDWEFPAGGDAAPVREATCRDPGIAQLDPAAAQAMLQPLADRRATLRFGWGLQRVAIAASGRPTRAFELTDATFEARTGRRPGSGFAAGASRTLAGLAAQALVERARTREASEIAEGEPVADRPSVLSPEVVAVLTETLARLLFSGRRYVAGQGPLADPAERRPLAASLEIVDEPLSEEGILLPVDFDGVSKRTRPLVAKGECLEPALDLELAARCGRFSTGCGLAADDAYPLHPRLAAGGAGEAELLGRSGGGLRIGSIEQLRCIEAPGLPFRALARSVRRIADDGSLGPALPPLRWKGKLLDLFASIDGIGDELVVWSAGRGLGAARAPALRLLASGELDASGEGRL